jgi:hypothetical protein
MRLDRAGMDRAGVVHQDVDPAAGLGRLLDQADGRNRALEIGVDEDHANAALGFERSAKALRLLRITQTVNDDGGAVARQRPCDRPPDAAG